MADKANAFYETMSRGELDQAVEFLHRDVEVRPALGGVLDLDRRYSGRDGAKRILETLSEGAERIELRVEQIEVIEGGDDRVVIVERWHPRGRQGIETELVVTQIYIFRDGLIAHINGFRDKAEALEAAGLSE